MKKKLLAVILSIAMFSTSMALPAVAGEAGGEETVETSPEEEKKPAVEEQAPEKQEEASEADNSPGTVEEAGADEEAQPADGEEQGKSDAQAPAAGEESKPDAAEDSGDSAGENTEPETSEEIEGTWDGPDPAQNDAADYVASPEYITSGKCGENARWTVTETDNGMLLEITGSGPLYESRDTESSQMIYSWYAYHEKITEAYIGSGITELSDCMFQDMTRLKKVTLPGTLSCIPEYCFSGCSSLGQVTWSSGPEEIGNYAFASCGRLIK